MSSFAKLKEQIPACIAEYFQLARLAEEARQRETAAVVTIQKYARGFLVRRRLDHFRDRAICIQRCWRGYLGRLRAGLAKEARDKRLREHYFAAMATLIQQHWRGFWSRKYVFDFYARKLYLLRVAQLNAQMRAELTEEGERAALLQKSLAEQAARAAFDSKVSKLHHLLSTTSQPGIFASPYALATGNVPVIAGAPVEEHLKAAFKKAYTSATSTSGSGRSSGGRTFLPPIKQGRANSQGSNSNSPPPGSQRGAALASQGSATGQSTVGSGAAAVGSGPGARDGSRRSRSPAYPGEVLLGGTGQLVGRNVTLRQAVPYDTVHQAQLLEEKVVRAEMLLRHPLPFMHATRKPEAPAIGIQSNRNLEQYVTPWDPTVGNRTDVFTPQQQAVSPTRFSRYKGHVPYFDSGLHSDAEALPPTTYKPPPPLQHAAGITSADLRRMAKQPVA